MNRTIWRWFPVGLFASMGLVFAVNFYMVYDAYQTFPGVAGADGFDLSNQYNNVLAKARQQAALGWQIDTELSADRFLVLRLTNRDGSPLDAATISARAERPVGPVDATTLTFQPLADGGLRSDTPLLPGQWDIMLTVQSNGQRYNATRRVVVK